MLKVCAARVVYFAVYLCIQVVFVLQLTVSACWGESNSRHRRKEGFWGIKCLGLKERRKFKPWIKTTLFLFFLFFLNFFLYLLLLFFYLSDTLNRSRNTRDECMLFWWILSYKPSNKYFYKFACLNTYTPIFNWKIKGVLWKEVRRGQAMAGKTSTSERIY